MSKIIKLSITIFCFLTTFFVANAISQSYQLDSLLVQANRHQSVINKTMTNGSCQSVNACTTSQKGVGLAANDCKPTETCQ